MCEASSLRCCISVQQVRALVSLNDKSPIQHINCLNACLIDTPWINVGLVFLCMLEQYKRPIYFPLSSSFGFYLSHTRFPLNLFSYSSFFSLLDSICKYYPQWELAFFFPNIFKFPIVFQSVYESEAESVVSLYCPYSFEAVTGQSL